MQLNETRIDFWFVNFVYTTIYVIFQTKKPQKNKSANLFKVSHSVTKNKVFRKIVIYCQKPQKP